MILKNKRGFVENMGLFGLFLAIGFIMMMVALKVWAKMGTDVGLFTKILMLTVIPVGVAYFFARRYE